MKRTARKRAIKPPKLSHNRSLIIISIFFLTLVTIGYFLYKYLATPLRVAEVSSTPTCNNYASSSIEPVSVKPGDLVKVTCDYGKAPIDCVKVSALPNDFESCTFAQFEENKVVFNCIAPKQVGLYTQLCERFETNECKSLGLDTSCQNIGQDFAVVNPDIAAPSKPSITTSCDGVRSKVQISWDGTPATEGFWVDIAEDPHHFVFYNKLVSSGKSTDINDFVGASASNANQPLELDNSKTYYAWVFNGNVSSRSDAFKPKNCASPLPATPTTTLHNTNTTCTSLSFSWDQINNVAGYIIDIADNQDFNNSKSSGVLQSTYNKYTFEGLQVNQPYYIRLSAANIHDFPRYIYLKNIRTSPSCVTTTPKPSIVPYSKPTPSTTSTPQANYQNSYTPIPKPSIYDGNTQINDYTTPSTSEDQRQPRSLLGSFIAWLTNLFK